MAWKIKARYFEACNCDFGCPCNMSGFPTYGSCEGSVAFEVIEGERDGVDLAGAKVAAAAKWPGAIHEGNGSLLVFIDATEEQVAALGPILMAEDPGLPWEILATTVTDLHGPFLEPITIVDKGTESSVKVGDKYDVQLASFVDPVSGQKNVPHMVLESGFIWKDGHIGTTSSNKVDHDGVSYDHAGKNSFYSVVEWSSENRLVPA